MASNKWVVDKKKEKNNLNYEISVLREGNNHGKSGYGWFGEDKIFIFHNASYDIVINERVWNKQLLLAQEVADELNIEEGE